MIFLYIALFIALLLLSIDTAVHFYQTVTATTTQTKTFWQWVTYPARQLKTYFSPFERFYRKQTKSVTLLVVQHALTGRYSVTNDVENHWVDDWADNWSAVWFNSPQLAARYFWRVVFDAWRDEINIAKTRGVEVVTQDAYRKLRYEEVKE